MVEPSNPWDTDADGIPGDEEFENILNILDFPMESLEGDEFVGDWDISKLGPIPSNVLMGPPIISHDKIDLGPAYFLPGPVPPIAGAPEQKHLPEASGSHVLQRNKFADVQEPGAFQTESPVSVLESSGSYSAGRSLPIKSCNAIPKRTRSRRARPTGLGPWLSTSPLFPTTSTSKRASNTRKDKERMKKFSHLPVTLEATRNPPVKVENSSPALDYYHPELQVASSHRPAAPKKCTHCEVTKTPQWREGPLGPKTLCNACGVRYRSGRLFPEYRPAASPTFSPTRHSNSHKKVIEMRNKGKQPEIKTEEPSISSSPQPEFVPMSSYLFDYID